MSWIEFLRKVVRSDSPKLKRPMRALIGYILQRLSLSEWIELQRAGYRIPFYRQSNISLTLWVDSTFVDLVEEFTTRYLRPGDTFIDVGANIGCITCAASTVVGDRGRVLALEPHHLTYALLVRSVAYNGLTNVACLNAAAGRESSMVFLTNEKRKDDCNRVVSNAAVNLAVPCMKLGDIIKSRHIDRVALLKIDVEGYEKEVVLGLAEVSIELTVFLLRLSTKI